METYRCILHFLEEIWVYCSSRRNRWQSECVCVCVREQDKEREVDVNDKSSLVLSQLHPTRPQARQRSFFLPSFLHSSLLIFFLSLSLRRTKLIFSNSIPCSVCLPSSAFPLFFILSVVAVTSCHVAVVINQGRNISRLQSITLNLQI